MVAGNDKDRKINKIQVSDIVIGIIIYISAFFIGLVIFLMAPIEEKYFGYFVSRFAGYLIMVYGFVYWRIFVQNRNGVNKKIKAIINFIIVTVVCAIVFIIGPIKNEYLREMAESASFSLSNIGGVIIFVVFVILMFIYVFEELIDKNTGGIKDEKKTAAEKHKKISEKAKKETVGMLIGGYAAILLAAATISDFLGIDYEFGGYELVGVFFVVMTPLLYGYYLNKIRYKNKTTKMRYLIAFLITAAIAVVYGHVVANMHEANNLKELFAIYAAVLGVVLMCVVMGLSFLVEMVQDRIISFIKGEDSEVSIKKINICTECGEKNRKGADFCGKCGRRL